MAKKIIPILLLIFLFSGISAQKFPVLQHFAGKYWLAVIPGANLPLNLTFESANDSLYPVLYSPTQSKEPIRADSWLLSHDTLTYTCNRLRIKLSVLYNGKEDCFTGSFRQGASFSKLRFSPAEGLFQMVRPQEPKEPFSFTEEDVCVETGGGAVSLSGTLTLPKKGGNFPALVLVSGSGLQNRDEEIFGHKPFLLIAEHFARRGIAVLRYDDRGCGKSKGNVADATTLDFADDAEAMFDFLRKHRKIDRKRVGILGHSEGALIAQIVASRNRNVEFIVSYAGQGYNGADILYQQNRAFLHLLDIPDSNIETRIACMKDFFAIADTAPDKDFIRLFKNVVKEKAASLSKEELSQCGLDGNGIFGFAQQLRSPWMKTFLKLDPKDYLPKIRCRILAIGGSNDCQVLAEENLSKISELTQNRASIKKFDGLNHLFQHCDYHNSMNYIIIEETTNPEPLAFIASWILEK